MLPLFIDPSYVTPVIDSEPLICARCLKKSARWLTGKHPEVRSECSYCLLYKTDWGRKNSSVIRSFVALVQGEMGKTITDSDGNVVEEEADRIVASIRQTSAAKQVLSRLRRAGR